MSSDDIAIDVRDLSKRYQIYESPRDRLKQFVLPRLQSLAGRAVKSYFHEFVAVENISFSIKKGDTVGVIGRNGSGKSTLLQILCGTLSPSSGRVETNGRIAALLELGSGFNPEFTGRENVFMNAAVLGLDRSQISERFDDIVAFADIGAFIDQPVKTYSSGMYVRLAFAVIAHVDADILVIDEALAVGDVFFQQKCMRYLRSHQERGGTVLFVSHDTGAITSLCDRAILLSRNKSPIEGGTEEICKIYLKELYSDSDRTALVQTQRDIATAAEKNKAVSVSKDIKKQVFKSNEQPENEIRITPFRHEADSFGHQKIKIVDSWFENAAGSRAELIKGGEIIHLCIAVESFESVPNVAFGFMIKDRLGQYIFAEGTDLAFRNDPIFINSGEVAIAKFSFLMPILIQGSYSINIAVAEGIGDDHIQHHWIDDVLALHSLQSRLVHGINGLQKLNIEVTVSSAR